MILLILALVPMSILFFIYSAYFYAMRRYSMQPTTWKSGKVDVSVSVIIATYNEESTLPAKLANILELDFPKDNLELVLIDSASTDNTPAIIEKFIAENPNLKTVFLKESERRGKSHALNIAYPRATGKIKIISDSDCLLEKTALSRVIGNFVDPQIGAVFGWQVLINADQNPTTLLEKSYKDIWLVLRRGESILDSTPLFDGELSAYRADLIEPLPEKKSGDDARMANIIRRKGYRTVCDSSAIFYEYAPPDSSARWTQKLRRAQGIVRVFWDFRNCLFKRQYGAYGLLIMPMEFCMHCIFPAMWIFLIALFLAGLAYFSLIAFFSFLALVAVFFIVNRIRIKSGYFDKVKAFASLTSAFLSSQIFLFHATLLWVSGRSMHKWQKVEGIRQKWKTDHQQ